MNQFNPAFSAVCKRRVRMLAAMTEPTPPEQVDTTTTPSNERAAEPPLNQRRWHQRGGIYRLSALIGALAGTVFIVAVIFGGGVLLGAELGGHEDNEGRGHSQQESDRSDEGLEQERGRGTDTGDEYERPFPSVPSSTPAVPGQSVTPRP